MIAKNSIYVATAVLGAALAASAASPSPQTTATENAGLLPPDAKPGQCYAKVSVPPTYETKTEQRLTREEGERTEVIPARFEPTEEKVLVKQASERAETVPATYEWVDQQVVVKAATRRVEQIPARYETVSERVVDRPAHTIWKKGTGLLQKVDNATGEVMCLVEVPATYKTLTRRVMKTPATTRTIEIPAQHRTVRRRVVKTPAGTRKVAIPAVYKTVSVMKQISPAETRRIPVPAEYQTVTYKEVQTEGRMEWEPVLCETNISPDVVMSIQKSLKQAGHNPGAIDGVIGSATTTAIRSFQRAKGLPVGQLTLKTLDVLGVQLSQ